jgi:hypothetical protein
VTALCESGGSRVTVSGSLIHLSEVQTLLTECDRLHSTLAGKAALKCMDPNLSLLLEATGRTVHFDVTI